MNQTRPVMIVEDSDEDFEVTSWALEKAGFSGEIIRCVRAEEALLQLCPAPPPPDQPVSTQGHSLPCVVLLDLNLPGMNGIDLLTAVRSSERPPAVPIVVLSTSSNPRDIAACYRLGAAGYLCKPLKIEHYVEKLLGLIHYWLATVTLPPTDGP